MAQNLSQPSTIEMLYRSTGTLVLVSRQGTTTWMTTECSLPERLTVLARVSRHKAGTIHSYAIQKGAMRSESRHMMHQEGAFGFNLFCLFFCYTFLNVFTTRHLTFGHALPFPLFSWE